MTFNIISLKGEPSVIEDRAHSSILSTVNQYINDNLHPPVHAITGVDIKMTSVSKTVSTITGVRQFTYTGVAYITYTQETEEERVDRVKAEVKHLKAIGVWPEDQASIPWYKKIFKRNKKETE